MSLSRIFKESFGKVLTAPSLVLWVFCLLFLIAIPASLVMRELISNSIGPSLVQENLRTGFDLDWWGEFLHENSGGLASTFSPDVTGGLPVLGNVETFLDGRLGQARLPVLFSGLFFLLIWVFLQGGIIDRYANPDEDHSRERLFSQSAKNFYRMSRLAVVAAGGYWFIFVFLGGRLNSWKNDFFSDSTVEGPVIFATVLAYLTLFLLWWVFNLGMDYAKVALVVQRRRSALVSAIKGFGFVVSHPGKCFGISLIMAFFTLLVGGAYFFLAPGPEQSTWRAIGIAFLIGQVYLLARISTRLLTIAAEATLFTASDVSLPSPQYLEPEPGEHYKRASLVPAIPVRAEGGPEEAASSEEVVFVEEPAVETAEIVEDPAEAEDAEKPSDGKP